MPSEHNFFKISTCTDVFKNPYTCEDMSTVFQSYLNRVFLSKDSYKNMVFFYLT